jgi:hypothetical protein
MKRRGVVACTAAMGLQVPRVPMAQSAPRTVLLRAERVIE